MRIKLLLISLIALSLLVACRSERMQRAKALPQVKQNSGQSTASKPTPKATPKFIGVYKHLSIAADAPAIDSTLYLNVDGSFKLIDEYVGKATNTEVGAWAANLDGTATVTTTGQLDRKYDKPSVAQARFTDDSQTVLTVTTGKEGDKGVQWTRFEALVQDYTKAGYDAKATTAAIQQRGWAGLYKAALPAADCCGLDISLFLNVDKSAEFRSDYLNGKPTVEEIGTWTASATQTLTSTAPVTVTVVITGAKDQPTYDKPQTLQLTLQNGVLVTTKTSAILPDGHLKLYSIDGLIAPERAALTAQAATEKPTLDPMVQQLQRRHPLLFKILRGLWRLSQMLHRHWRDAPVQPSF